MMTPEEIATWVDKSGLAELVARLAAAVDCADRAAIGDCYIDYFRRSDCGWKVSYRRAVPDITIPGDGAAQYWQPRRDGTDPRYDRLTAPPT